MVTEPSDSDHRPLRNTFPLNPRRSGKSKVPLLPKTSDDDVSRCPVAVIVAKYLPTSRWGVPTVVHPAKASAMSSASAINQMRPM
jgi:hypothetical protein